MTESEIEGLVVHIRKTSKKLAFFDVEPEVTRDSGRGRVTVVLKAWESGEAIVRAVRGETKIHLGDKVSFKGYFEDEDTFCALDYQILSLWSERCPDKTFQPKPPENNHAKDSSNLPCKEFVNTGQCKKSKCLYLHISDRSELIEKRQEFVKEKKERRLLEHENDSGAEVAGNSQRARIFSEWIVDTYGLGRLLIKWLIANNHTNNHKVNDW